MCSDRLLPLLLSVIALCGCSVWEDRTDCPCFLTVDCSGVDCWSMMDAGNRRLSWNVSHLDGEWCRAGDIVLDTLAPAFELEVPKDSLCVSASCGADLAPDGGVHVEEGAAFPRLYFHSALVDASGATARDSVVLHREHAELFLYIRNLMLEGAAYDIEGSVAGCDNCGRPVQGRFLTRVHTDSRGFGSVVIPRQVDGSLRLNVTYAGELVRSLAIGEYIIQSGYDWNALDLEDISMVVEYYQTKVTIRIEQWKKTLTFTVVF